MQSLPLPIYTFYQICIILVREQIKQIPFSPECIISQSERNTASKKSIVKHPTFCPSFALHWEQNAWITRRTFHLNWCLSLCVLSCRGESSKLKIALLRTVSVNYWDLIFEGYHSRSFYKEKLTWLLRFERLNWQAILLHYINHDCLKDIPRSKYELCKTQRLALDGSKVPALPIFQRWLGSRHLYNSTWTLNATIVAAV